MADPKTQYMAVFMPWAGIGNEMKIGPVTFWDYHRQADEKIKDPAIRNQLDEILACYISHGGNPVSTVVLVTHGAADFRVLNEVELQDVQRAVDSYTFSVIYPNTRDGIRLKRLDMAPPSSDRYQFYMQSFTPGSTHVSIRAGVSNHMWLLKDLRISQPWAIGGFASHPDDDLLVALSGVLDPVFPEDDRRRIMRSLEWFRMAHTQADNVHTLPKVIMMATAFETLLQIGAEEAKAKFFRQRVDEKFSYKNARTETYPEWKKGKPAVQVPVTYTKAAWWAKNFYDIRSDITHGDYIEPARARFPLPDTKMMLPQLDVAAIVFGEMLLWELEERKLCGTKVDAFVNSIRGIGGNEENGPLEWKNWAFGVRREHNLTDVHETLGWATPPPGKKIKPWPDEDD